MKCKLCHEEIINYSSTFNHLIINESTSIDICNNCIDKFVKWQQAIFARLYPTPAMKKLYAKKRV